MDHRANNRRNQDRTAGQMDYITKHKLVQDMAKAMGLSGGTANKAANFDAATGTLYVGSKVYIPEQIEQAKGFMEAQTRKFEPMGDDTYQMYEIAMNAILFMQKYHEKKHQGLYVIEE